MIQAVTPEARPTGKSWYVERMAVPPRNKRRRTLEQIQVDVTRKMAPWPTLADSDGKAAVREAMTGKPLNILIKK